MASYGRPRSGLSAVRGRALVREAFGLVASSLPRWRWHGGAYVMPTWQTTKRVPIIAKSALLPPKSPGPQECPGTLWNVPGTLEEYSCGPYLPTDQSEFDWEVKLEFF